MVEAAAKPKTGLHLESAVSSLSSICMSLQGLALFRGGVLMVSHDQHLIESTVDELWAVEQGTGAAGRV